jgi:hypothetical protein
MACAGGSAARGSEPRFDGRIQIQGDAEVNVVDAQARVDSLAFGPGSAGSGGIPGCERDEDYSPQVRATDDTTEFKQEPVTAFNFTDARMGRYRFWMRPRRDQANVWLLWSRWFDGETCGSTVVVDKWKQGQWYLWEVEILPVSKSDTCGVKVGTLTEAPAPKVGK